MVGRSRSLLLGGVALSVAVFGCSNSSDTACDDLRAELAQLTPTAEQAWEDISVLQTDTSRTLELEQEIADRCG